VVGSETGGRRYAAFTINTERLKPWHTLSGRMHFFLDHDWMKPTRASQLADLPAAAGHDQGDYGETRARPNGEKAITLRYLTVHNKWSIHSEYQDNLFMLSLSARRSHRPG
jgi:nitrate reductase alpha subunit